MGWLFGKGKTPKEESRNNLFKALRSTEPGICLQAVELAGQQRMKDAVPALVEILYISEAAFRPVRIAVARALGEIGDLRALQHLGEANYWEPWPEGEEVLSAIEEAHNKLWKQPGADAYIAQLGKIVMYRIADFTRSANIYIESDIQVRELYPFTMECAKRFFDCFKRESFAFEGKVGSIRIYRGKEALPRHSYAIGWLYSQTIDEMEKQGKWPDRPIGEIDLELGGNATAPYVSVKPEPNWPVPSIVRRSVIDGGTGVRFEEKS
jgi:hypothetical protein